MPTDVRRLVNILFLLVAVLFGLLAWVYFGRVDNMYSYLGYSHGDDPARWKGLSGYLKAEATHFRPFIYNLNCRLRKIEVPPNPCPEGEPPSTRPSNPPGHP